MSTRITNAAFVALTALCPDRLWRDTSHTFAAQGDDRITGVVWTDSNCDGVRQDGEALLPHARLTLRWAGTNGTIDGTDPDIEQSESLTGQYVFTLGAAGEPYFIAFRSEDKPAHTRPAPFRQGSDPTHDNDLTMPLAGTSLWATPVFTLPAAGSVMTGQDIGLCVVQFDPANTVYLPAVPR
jgi:hypothetical protein